MVCHRPKCGISADYLEMVKKNQNMHNIKQFFLYTVQQFEEAVFLDASQREDMVGTS